MHLLLASTFALMAELVLLCVALGVCSALLQKSFTHVDSCHHTAIQNLQVRAFLTHSYLLLGANLNQNQLSEFQGPADDANSSSMHLQCVCRNRHQLALPVTTFTFNTLSAQLHDFADNVKSCCRHCCYSCFLVQSQSRVDGHSQHWKLLP